MKRLRIISLATTAWVALVAGGLGYLAQYASKAGPASHAPANWPSQAPVPLASGKATLVLFLHPHCPCSRASLREVEKTLAHSGDRLEATVFFLSPSEKSKEWVHSSLWEEASRIPHVVVREDPQGKTSRLFHATTSG